MSSHCCCCRPLFSTESTVSIFVSRKRASIGIIKSVSCAETSFRGRSFDVTNKRRSCGLRASMVDSYDNSPNLLKRMERAWLISQQPRPVSCSSCGSNGHVECKWCGGTGFFILGDNMLCEVPSRNTSCVICAGKGVTCCSDCKGTGFRAKWMEQPSIH